MRRFGYRTRCCQAEQAIDDLVDNFPEPLVAGVMRLVIFFRPVIIVRRRIGWPTRSPNSVGCPAPRAPASVAGQYLTPSEHNPVGLLEEALLEK